MMKRPYRKALAVLALCALLWALPAFAAGALPTPAADGTAAAPTATAAPDPTTAPDTAPAAQTEAAGTDQARSPLGGLTTASGGAALVGVGAYSYVRKQRQEERDRRRAAPQEPVYFENHTQNGTLRPEESGGRNDIE